jgi:hypothetical protein
MIELEILKLWIVPQQGKKHSEIDEEPIVLMDWPNGASVFRLDVHFFRNARLHSDIAFWYHPGGAKTLPNTLLIFLIEWIFLSRSTT